ncbi:hypothetical protein EXIGLDRAFT_833079 [Exidia glandulosa HHB12029]|uniref:Homeobox domain-containing protein n=1 Tax=Exidia glandulosa HHB12029 TaxID=1314781 RepID=A0A165L204_EXIGL|nr:hypothetical protein EXIGLDRAFT_846818 [Exidia glandulosa HHB12029]KZV97227.1 hypothetical protein EXIGLDRAFT_833079 [Exidia glandulosa HHB12029]
MFDSYHQPGPQRYPPQPGHPAMAGYDGYPQHMQLVPVVGGYVHPSAGFMDDVAFHSYYPNDVRHRKRTSRAQLIVLEAAFEEDQKPGPSIRMEISQQIGMTVRAVQVWFQNRRAKEKNLQKKQAQAIAHRNGKGSSDGGDDDDDAKNDGDAKLEDLTDDLSLPADTLTTPTEATVHPGDAHNTAKSNRPSPQSVATPPPASPPESVGTTRSTSEMSAPRSSPDLRRGSAPAVVSDVQGAEPLGPPDAMRRQSLEMTFARMNAQPYPPQSMRHAGPPSSFHRSISRNQLAVNTDMRARPLARAPSGPAALASTYESQAPSANPGLMRTHSHPSVAGWVNQQTAASAAAAASSGFHVRAPAPQHLPGPLPAADFSFGAPPAPMDQAFAERSGRLAYGREDEPESPSVGDAYSRYGSFASVSEGDPAAVAARRFGSIASGTSAETDPTHGTRFSSFASVDSSASASTYYSLATPDGWAPESRRSSCTEFSNMLSRMHVGTPAAPTPELYKSPPPPQQQVDAGVVHYETSPSSSDGSSGTVHYAPSPPDSARIAHPEQYQQPQQHRSELEFALNMAPPPVGKEPLRQRFTPPAQYHHQPSSSLGRKMSMPAVHRPAQSSSLENAMGNSSLGLSTSSIGSAASSNSSLPLLATPIDVPQSFAPAAASEQNSAAASSSPMPMLVGSDYQQQCFAPQTPMQAYYPPAVHVQPPSAGGVGLGIDHPYPFFGA